MKFLLVLILAAFVQTSFLPINLCLILIIARVLIVTDKYNLLTAFIAGLLISFLSLTNLSFYTLIFLFVTKLAQIYKSSRLSSNIITIGGFSLFIFLLNGLLEKAILGITFKLSLVLWELVVLILTYLIMLFWEERFIANKPLRLKI